MQTEFTCIKRLGAGHKADLKIGKHDASTNADEPRKLRTEELMLLNCGVEEDS